MLEDALRRTFAARTAQSPALDDPATAAIRRARRIRRRRNILGSAAAAVAVALFGGGLVSVQDWRLAQRGNATQMTAVDAPTPPGEATVVAEEPDPDLSLGPRPDVDLFAAGYMWTAEGLRISVTEPDTAVTNAYRVPLGWVVGDADDSRLVRSDGGIVPLEIGERWILSPDGTRVAYVTDRTLRVASLNAAGMTDLASTEVDADRVPVAFAGDQVVVGEIQPDGRLVAVDRWSPGEPYRPGSPQQAFGVYEAHVGDVVAQVPGAGGAACLIRLAVRDDGVRPASDAACGIGVPGSGPRPLISPDGRWLAVPMPATVAIYDLTTVFRTPIPAATCAASPTTDLIWESSGTLLAAAGVTVVRCRPDGSTEPVAMPSGLPDGWRFVQSRQPSR